MFSSSLPPQLFWFLAATALAFGCCVGSYLNVVIYRLPLGLSTHEPKRSFCPKCRYGIPFYHNIPIVSWLVLRGRCANCQSPISPRYLFVELFTGLLFLAAFLKFGVHWHTLSACTFLALAVAGSCIDIDHQILPHPITFGGAAAGLIFSLAIPEFLVEGSRVANLLQALAGAALGYGLIWIIIQLGKLAFGKLKLEFDEPAEWSIRQPEGEPEPSFTVAGEAELWGDIFSRRSDRLIIRAASATLGSEAPLENVMLKLSEDSVEITDANGAVTRRKLEDIPCMEGTCRAVEQPREAMGLGDANWMACVGAFLGWKGVLFTIFAGSVIGAAFSLSLIIARRREWAGRIPFGPYLAAGAVIFLFFGPRILDWYFHLGRPAEVMLDY